MKKVTGVVFGVLLIAVGIVYGLSSLGIAEFNFSLDGWWALFLIVPGITGIFTSRDKIGNLIVTLIGVYLLLAARGVIGYGDFWELLVPAVIVLIGVKVIISAFSGKESHRAADGVTECTASFEKKKSPFRERTYILPASAPFSAVRSAIFRTLTFRTAGR